MKPSQRFDTLFQYWGFVYNQPPEILKAIAWQESRFNPSAQSAAGAKGLMQFMPATFVELEPMRVIWDSDAQVAAAAKYIARLWDRYAWSTLWEHVLAAYNAGPGRVSKAIEARGSGWLVALPKETQDYVVKVLAKAQEYKDGGL